MSSIIFYKNIYVCCIFKYVITLKFIFQILSHLISVFAKIILYILQFPRLVTLCPKTYCFIFYLLIPVYQLLIPYFILTSVFFPFSVSLPFCTNTSQTLLKPERQPTPLPCLEQTQFLDQSPDKNRLEHSATLYFSSLCLELPANK